jgi:hypothetical protein
VQSQLTISVLVQEFNEAVATLQAATATVYHALYCWVVGTCTADHFFVDVLKDYDDHPYQSQQETSKSQTA